MRIEKLIVFVEEYSMEVALEILLPRMLGAIEYQIITFSCKNELLKHSSSIWISKSVMILQELHQMQLSGLLLLMHRKKAGRYSV